MMPLIIQNLDMLNSNNNSDKNKTGSRNDNNENTNHSSGPSQQSTSMEEVTNISQEEEQQEKDNPTGMDPVNSKEMGVKEPELGVKAADLGVKELQADQGKEDQAEKDEDLQDQVLQGNLESKGHEQVKAPLQEKAKEPQHAEDTSNQQLKSLSASSLHEDDDYEDDEEGGAYIVVGDNDSVSSLDSTDSFAYESLSEAEDQDSRMRRPRRRRRRPNQQDQQHAEHQLQQLRRPTKRDEQQQLNNHTPASQRRVLRRSRVAASKVAGPIRAKTSPNMPRRQKTREVGSGGGGVAAAATAKRYTPRSLQRNFSNPELLSPGSDSDKANHTDLPTPRESMQSVSHSIHSLNHLELWNDDSHDNHIRNDNSAMERWNDSAMQDSSDLHHALSMHSGDNSDATNAGSRWSASASTGHRSMNTAQLDQLSTVPRFPRRQKTGENMHRARQQAVQQQRQASRDGQDNNSTTASNNNNNNNANVNPRESVSSTTTTTKKRPQLPNRQKSFRRNVMTMNQAAQAALAIAEQNNNNNNGGNMSPNSHAPSMPRRSVSGDTSCTGSFSRQKSLPNLRPNRHNPCSTLDAAEKELLSISLHQEKKPRLPERKASRRPRRGSATGTSNHTHNTSTSRSPHAIAKGTRIRRAKSDGVRKVNIGNLLQDIQDDDSEFANNGVNAADLQSSWSAASFGVEDDGDQPKMPRRQASRDDIPAPPSVAAAVLAAGSNHNYQYESANSNNNNAKIPERIPSASTAWSTNTARMSLMGGGSVSDGHTVASSQYGDGPRSRASGTSDLISLSLHSTASLSLPNKPLRQGTDENFQYTPRAGGEAMSNNSKQSISSTTVEGPKMPRRQVSHDDENEKGPPMRRLDTINSVGVDAEEEPVDLDHEEEEDEEDEDAGNLGDQEDDDDDTFADDDDDEDEDEEGHLDSMSELPDLPPSRRLSDAAPPRSLNLVHHNASMSTLDESNNSHLHHSSGQKSLKVGRTSSTTTATTTASTLSGNTKSTSGGGDSLIRLPKRQVSNSESRQHAEADTGGTNNDNDMTIVEEADEGDEDVVKSVDNNLEASSTLANATLSAAAASEGDQVFAEAAASS